MQSFNKILVAALVAATATGAGAEGALDLRHSGDESLISTRVVDSDLRIVSHGDGGVIDAGFSAAQTSPSMRSGNETAARAAPVERVGPDCHVWSVSARHGACVPHRDGGQ